LSIVKLLFVDTDSEPLKPVNIKENNAAEGKTVNTAAAVVDAVPAAAEYVLAAAESVPAAVESVPAAVESVTAASKSVPSAVESVTADSDPSNDPSGNSDK
jgi:hypothetical protein